MALQLVKKFPILHGNMPLVIVFKTVPICSDLYFVILFKTLAIFSYLYVAIMLKTARHLSHPDAVQKERSNFRRIVEHFDQVSFFSVRTS
jgi:hypothetical protein